MEQRSQEWFEARLGKVTASRIGDLMAKTKTGYSASRQNYLEQIVCERLTGAVQNTFATPAMMRGVELEQVARERYAKETGLTVEEVGMIPHPNIEYTGASPDGLVGKDGLIEIKCPNTWTHLETIKTGEIDRKYMLQMQWQMACTGRAWCDFVSFDDRLPELLSFVVIRVQRDGDLIEEITEEVVKFLEEVDDYTCEVYDEYTKRFLS